ncbi:hypothetical protein PENTCL1PPCAC_22801, partial [Pristionchus entomophagus]
FRNFFSKASALFNVLYKMMIKDAGREAFHQVLHELNHAAKAFGLLGSEVGFDPPAFNRYSIPELKSVSNQRIDQLNIDGRSLLSGLITMCLSNVGEWDPDVPMDKNIENSASEGEEKKNEKEKGPMDKDYKWGRCWGEPDETERKEEEAKKNKKPKPLSYRVFNMDKKKEEADEKEKKDGDGEEEKTTPLLTLVSGFSVMRPARAGSDWNNHPIHYAMYTSPLTEAQPLKYLPYRRFHATMHAVTEGQILFLANVFGTFGTWYDYVHIDLTGANREEEYGLRCLDCRQLLRRQMQGREVQGLNEELHR